MRLTLFSYFVTCATLTMSFAQPLASPDTARENRSAADATSSPPTRWSWPVKVSLSMFAQTGGEINKESLPRRRSGRRMRRKHP